MDKWQNLSRNINLEYPKERIANWKDQNVLIPSAFTNVVWANVFFSSCTRTYLIIQFRERLVFHRASI